MDLNLSEIKKLFEINKFPCDKAIVEFPIQGESVEIELENEGGRVKFQSDISRKNKIVNKLTLQLRHKQEK